MSWAKVFKINSNLTKPLNTLMSELMSGVTTLLNTVNTNVTNTKTQVGTVNTTVNTINTNVNTVKTNTDSIKTSVASLGTQLTSVNNTIKDSRFLPMRIITSTTTFTPEKTGTYKIICVGAGGDGNINGAYLASGGGGGVAIKTLRLLSTTTYNVTVGSAASFTYNSTSITANAGSDGYARGQSGGSGGTASGGDYNYEGERGDDSTMTGSIPLGGSVGVFISELMVHKSRVHSAYSETVEMPYGNSILGYGGGGGASIIEDADGDNLELYSTGLPAAVIIIPLELEA